MDEKAKRVTFRKPVPGVNLWHRHMGREYAGGVTIVRASLTKPIGVYTVEWSDWANTKHVRTFARFADALTFAKGA